MVYLVIHTGHLSQLPHRPFMSTRIVARESELRDLPAPSRSKMASTPFSTESYFQTQPAPAGLEEHTDRIRTFVERWKGVEGKRVVLVTVR
jgi:hypothetical protein